MLMEKFYCYINENYACRDFPILKSSTHAESSQSSAIGTGQLLIIFFINKTICEIKRKSILKRLYSVGITDLSDSLIT